MTKATPGYAYEEFGWFSSANNSELDRTPARWQGTVIEAADELHRYITEGAQEKALAWHPSRIAAATIQATGLEKPRVGALTTISDFAKNVFRGTAALDQLVQVAAIAIRLGIDQEPASQRIDDATLTGTDIQYSRTAAANLAAKVGQEDPFMISLGYGGFTAGIIAGLEYERLTGVSLPAYPVRYSQYKSKDRQPFISEEERGYLTETLDGKTVVVFDEDTYSGATIGEAVCYFKRKFPETKSVIGLANRDHRKEKWSWFEDQGEWWEHYQSEQDPWPLRLESS